MKKNILFFAAAGVAGILAAGGRFSAVSAQGNAGSIEEKPAGGSAFSVPAEKFDVIRMKNGGKIVLRGDRGRRRLFRAVMIVSVNVFFLALIWALPKRKEAEFAVAYGLAGVSFILAVWTVLFSVLLYFWKTGAAAAVFAAGIGSLCACRSTLKALKGFDISLQAAAGTSAAVPKALPADKRLAMISGAPGEWPETDFLK